MQFQSILFVAWIALSVRAEKQYGYPQQDPRYRRYNPTRQQRIFPAPQERYMYGKKPQQLDPDVQEFQQPVIPTPVAPIPFFKAIKPLELVLPIFGDKMHCFLHEAPFSQCGHQSLQLLLLNQCLSMYFQVSKNVDGLCRAPTEDEVLREAAESKKREKMTGSGYGGKDTIPSTKYLAERCYQRAYLSITSAMVMCLTENMVRIQFIEHYSASAANNPIEGPMLYLRKLHQFIENVLQCSGHEAVSNYPMLYRTFKTATHVTYNPNSPYEVNTHGNLVLEPYMSYETTGLNDRSIGDYFLCSNRKDIRNTTLNSYGYGYYDKVASTTRYSMDLIQSCKTSSKSALGYSQTIVDGMSRHMSNVLHQCNAIKPSPVHGNHFLSDMTLRGLYDAVSASADEYSSITRPLSIAEIVVRHAGVQSQPLLEGHGIMYFCAFYACKANSNGNMDACFPEFLPEVDWNIPEQKCPQHELDYLSKTVSKCRSKGWLSTSEIQHDSSTQIYENALLRTSVCLSESEIVRFSSILYKDLDRLQDAHSLVYMRYLAIEKCFEDAKGKCKSSDELYLLSQKSLQSLHDQCITNRLNQLRRSNRQNPYTAEFRAPQARTTFASHRSQYPGV